MRNSRHEPEEPESSERWLVSYADFITLMFAFFAVLYATSEKDTAKAREFQESVKKYLIKASPMGGVGPQINTADKHNSPIEPPIQTYNNNKPDTIKVLDETEKYVESQFSEEERKKYFADISADDWGVRLVIPAHLLFSEGGEKFNSTAMPFMEKLSDLLAKSKHKVLVQGHVLPGETGTYKSTWEFASARATNFLRYVQSRGKLKSDALVMASLADSKPLFPDQPARPANSRLEIIILNDDMTF